LQEKIAVYNRIRETGIIAVIRARSSEDALKITEAVKEGGIDVIEITLTVPGAIDTIKTLSKIFNEEEILLGAGTVLDPESARLAMLAGAKFIVSPSLSLDVIKTCNRYQILNMPGCMTVTEMVAALEAGADIIKLFPGSILGPKSVKAFRGPLPQAQFIPTGGVNLDNAAEWLENGCLAVGIGSELTAGSDKGFFSRITEKARQFRTIVKEFHNQNN